MKPSHYLLQIVPPENPDHRLLFSCKKGASCLVNRQSLDLLLQGGGDKATINSLTRLGMLTDDPQQEQREILALPETLDAMATKLEILIVPGMRCNFACPYCYEGEKSKDRMSEQTATHVVNYVKKITTAATKKILLKFYGGEPLLHITEIKRIASALRPWAAAKGLSFGFHLVSNGFLLRPDIVKELQELGFSSTNITLDGPPHTHNQSRPLRNGGPSFDTIINNIRDCCDIIPIAVTGNYTRENYRDFPKLLDILLDNGLDQQRIKKIKFAPAMHTDAAASTGFHGGCSCHNEGWVAEAVVFLRAETMRRGFQPDKLAPNMCMMQRKNTVMINWDGLFYKCPALINKPEYAIGALPGLPDHAAMKHAKDWRQDPKCRACKYLPLCFGGCALMRLEREKSMAGVDCWLPFYEKIIPEILLQDWRAKNAGKKEQ